MLVQCSTSSSRISAGSSECGAADVHDHSGTDGGRTGSSAKIAAEVVGDRLEQRRVHGAVVRQDLADEAPRGGDLAGSGSRCGVADEHDLVRAVVHRQEQLATGLRDDRGDVLACSRRPPAARRAGTSWRSSAAA